MSRISPILFNAEMTQANLDGRKKATRRLIKPRYQGNECNILVVTNKATGERRIDTVDAEGNVCRTGIKPPYQPGDILYVRETWAFRCCIECMNIYEDESCMIGKTSTIHEDKDAISEGCYIYRAAHPHPESIIWRPSIHMPKAAARIWLKVTDIKIQRLQEMTLDDFLCEGVVIRPEAFNDPENAYLQARSAFIDIWDSTIPKEQRDIYGWAANPWVWVIEYERCKKPEPCILRGSVQHGDSRPCRGMKYECVKEMCLPKCDGDGFEITNEYGFVTVVSIWERDDRTSFIGGDVHLDSLNDDSDFGWIEMSFENLKENFVQIGREPEREER